jgi:hypothetical protein
MAMSEMKPKDNTERFVANTKIDTSDKRDRRVLSEVLQAHEDFKHRKSQRPQPQIWRTIMRSNTGKLAAAGFVPGGLFHAPPTWPSSLGQCIALLRDGHTGVWGPSDEPICEPPVEIAAVQGKAVVVQVYPAEQIKQPELKAELIDGRIKRGADVVRQFEDALDKIMAAKGLILDLRDNGGGSSSTGYAILKRLIDKPVEGSHWRTRQYTPAFRAWGREEQRYEGTHGTIEPSEGKRFGGPVVVLTGPATASAAEDFVVVFQTSARGKVVGRRTLGSTGQPLTIQLPGGGGAHICTKWDTYPGGREFVGIGCIPDVEVVPTRADIAAGRDVVLEKAVAVLREEIGL